MLDVVDSGTYGTGAVLDLPEGRYVVSSEVPAVFTSITCTGVASYLVTSDPHTDVVRGTGVIAVAVAPLLFLAGSVRRKPPA